MRKLLTCVLCLLSLSAAGATETKLQDESIYIGFEQLLSHPTTLTSEELSAIDFNVRRVALYHSEDKLHKRLPKQTRRMIEGQIIKRLLATSRFQVSECVECSLINVVVSENQIKVNQSIETNKDMKELGEKLGLDAFFVWTANVIDDEFNIDIRLVRANTSDILWNQQYSKRINQNVDNFDQVSWRVSLSNWGYGATREHTAGGESPQFNSLLSVGIKRMETLNDSSIMQYGLGAEYFFNFENTDYLSFKGVGVTGRVQADLDVIHSSIYAELEGAFLFEYGETLLFKTGLEFDFLANGYASVGIVYMEERTYEWPDAGNLPLADSSKMGGLTYDVTVGYRF